MSAVALFLPGCDPGQDGAPEPFDIIDAEAALRIVALAQPTLAVHLAAVSAVTDAARDPRRAWDVNLTGTLNLVLALQQEAPNCRLLHVSTSEVYGASLGAPGGVDETALLQPLNPYAASKAAADILVRQAAAAGLHAIVARPFNHTGPGQSESFMVPNFAAQVARIEAGLQVPMINVGDLHSGRDFLDVEDVVSAYCALLIGMSMLEKGEVYNICSQKTQKVGDILNFILKASKVRIEICVDPSRLRSVPVQNVTARSEKIRLATAWKPLINFEETLRGTLEAARLQIVDHS